MGNHIGTISWTKTDRDDHYFNQLDQLRRKYSLERDEQNMLPGNTMDKTINHYSVEIAGFSIIWYGGDEKVKTLIKAFLYDATQIFSKDGVRYEVLEGHLPM